MNIYTILNRLFVNIFNVFRIKYPKKMYKQKIKGSDTLNSSLIVLKSMTEANKARYVLEKLKINSIVEKITTFKGGCSYGIRVYDDPDKICRLLNMSNVNCLEIRRDK